MKARQVHPSTPADAHLRTDKREDGILYDAVVLFKRGEEWEGTLPAPAYVNGGVAAVLSDAENRLKSL